MTPRHLVVCLVLAGALLLAPRATLAQDIEDVAVEDVLELDLGDKLGTTEAASRQAENVLRAPARVTTLDHEQIRLAGAQSIPELLRWIPGVQVTRIAAGNYLVAMRGAGGITGNNVVVLIDGSPVNRMSDGSVDWNMIPLHPADLDRIEVVSGPVSTIYGANAYTGVINLVTRDVIAESPSYAARAQWGADLDGNSVGALSARYLYHEGDVQAAAFTRLALDDTSNTTAAGDETPGLGSVGAAAHYRHAVSERSSFEVSALANVGRRGATDNLVVDDSREDPVFVSTSASVATGGLGPIDELSLWVQEVYSRTSASDDDATGFTYAGTRWNRATAGTSADLRLHSTLTAKATAQANLDWLDAPYIHPNENDKLRMGFGLGAGLRFTPTDSIDLAAELRGDDSPMTGTFELSYRGGVVYHTDSYAVRATVGSAYRSPTYVEVGGRFVDPSSGLILLEGTPDLASPRSRSADLSAIVSPTFDLTIAPTLFVARYSNVVHQDFEPLVRRSFTSSDDAHDVLGAELNLDWRIRRSLWLHGTVGWLEYLGHHGDHGAGQATIAVPEQNPALIAGLRLRGTALDGRLGFGAGALYTSARDFRTATGIPPALLLENLGDYAIVDGMVELQAFSDTPLWLSARARTNAPSNARESALPTAGEASTTVLLGVEYRTE